MHRRKGFTLIELLVVVAVIAVLVAMLMPTLSRAREAARLTQCMSGARQVFLAMEMYCNDFKGEYPDIYDGKIYVANPMPGYTHKQAIAPLWHQMLVDGKYMSPLMQTRRGGCPYGPDDFNAGDAFGGDYYSTPDPDRYPLLSSYGFNPSLQNGMNFKPDGIPTWWVYWRNWKRTSKPVRKHAEDVGVIFCSQCPWTWYTMHMYPALAQVGGQAPSYNYSINGPARHKGRGLPVACVDGHVEVMNSREINSFTAPSETQIFYYSFYYLHYTVSYDTE